MPKEIRAPFSATLEKYVIHALLIGALPFDQIKPEELSKQGRQVRAAAEKLASDGLKPPFQPDAVFLVASEIFGGERQGLRQYIQKCVASGSGAEIQDIIKAVRDREMLVKLVNTASEQLGKGSVDMGAINEVLSAQKNQNHLYPANRLLVSGIPPIPTGIAIRSLPALTESSGGVFGLWAIGGETGTGKSCLAWQISLEVGRERPVIYYDFENGAETLLHRTGEICRGDLDRTRRATKRIFIRDSIRSLDADLGSISSPALIVVDSVQKLPTSVLHRRTSLDAWIRRFEYLAKTGYSVLLTSEKQRAMYGQYTAGGYKETGEIEFSASFGLQIAKEEDETLKIFCVKNRHRPNTGLICTLERHPDKAWWYKEIEFGEQHVED